MLRNVIFALFAFTIVGLALVWILNGGPRKAYEGVRSFTTFNATTSDGLTLPWQPPGIFPFIEDDALFQDNLEEWEEYQAPEGLSEQQTLNDAITYGDPSPLFQKVRIRGGTSDTRTNDASREYVIIEASMGNTSPISLAGWSLQSAMTGVRAPISSAASPFSLGVVNTIYPVSLEPGDRAVITTGPSPVGVSFRENICSGYLSQLRSFEPSLSLQCPSPENEMSLSVGNLQRYGDTCIDYVRTIPTCEFPKEVPPHLTPECRQFVQTNLSYNGCVGRHLGESSFFENTWRLYIGSGTELWRDQHDAIRLLDAEGRTVDVYVY